MKRMYCFVLILVLSIVYSNAFAQSGVAINGTGAAPNSKAILDLDASSGTMGLLIPRMTSAERGVVGSPSTGFTLGLGVAEKGMTIFNTTSNLYEYWDGSAWQEIPNVANTGNTLDEAYDEGGPGAGRIINATNGNVEIQGTGFLTVASNIGIGTISPDRRMKISGAGWTALEVENTDAQDAAIELTSQSVSNYIFTDETGFLGLESATGEEISLRTDGANERMVVQSDGRVRINNLAEPTSAVVLSNAAGVLGKRPLTGSTTDVLLGTGVFGPASAFEDDDWYQVLTTNTPTGIGDWIYTNGRVGIGVGSASNPNAPLEVAATGSGNPANNSILANNYTNSAGNDAIITARVAGSSAGDPFFSLDISGEAGWSLGIDNSDDNRFKIAPSWSNLSAGTALTIQTDGNVGIGTTTPQHQFSVGTASADGQAVSVRSYSNSPPNWKGGGAFGYTSAAVIMGELNNVAQLGGHNGTLGAWADLAINSGGGNVGIGTTTPMATLNVKHPTSNTTPVPPSGNWAALIENNQDAADSRNGLAVAARWGGNQTTIFEAASYWNGSSQGYTPVLTVKGDRNVGIGTTSPNQRLEVAGNTRITGLAGGGDRLVYANNSGDLLPSSSTVNPNSLVDGGGTVNYLARWTPDGNTLGIGATQDDGTNVGIGVSPSYRLDVIRPTGVNQIRVQGGWDNTLNSNSRLVFNDDNFGIGAGQFGDASNEDVLNIWSFNGARRGILFSSTGSAATTTFQSMQHNMFIDGASGSVGIGTTSPDDRLHIYNATAQGNSALGGILSNNEVATLILEQRHSSTKTLEGVANAGFTASMIDFRSNNSGNERWSVGQVMGLVDAGSTPYSGGLAFTTSGGGTTNPADSRTQGANLPIRMLIQGDGDIGINTVSPTAKLHVANASPSNWEWSNLSNNVSLELGVNGAGNVGSIRLNSYDNNQFVFLRPSNGNYHVDATTGQYYFNWDESVRGTSNGAIHMANEAGTHTVEFNSAGNSWFTGGNLGIGTTGPIQNLDVNGRIHVANGVIQRGGTAITGTSDLGLYSRVSGNWIRYVTNAGAHMWYTDDNIGSTLRMGLDATGNLSVPTGYLTVGNPTVPGSTSTTQWNYTYWEEFDNYSYWSQTNGCSGTNWYLPFFSGGYIYYEQDANNDDDYAYTPFIWIPSNSDPNNIRARWSTYVCMESGYDGMRAQLSINGGGWSEITSFESGGYNNTADNNCGAGPFASAWGSDGGANFEPVVDLDSYGVQPGDWVRVRLEASTDGSTEECWDDIEVYWFTVEVVNQTNTAAFETGGIYAAGHIFAHSNSHVGDVAEYFPVNGPSEPGDLIAMDPKNPNVYQVSQGAYNPYVIGVYSTDPSVLVNSPDAGEPVGLSGRVPVKVVAEGGAIKVGDYLTSSSVKGHAMKATRSGYSIGRALENLEGETGTVMCLIEPGWYNPSTSGSTSGGSFFIGEGEKQVVVNDPSMTRDSRVFVSMLGNAGSQFWISEKQNGRFNIELAEAVSEDVRFDFFIDNANTETLTDTRPSSNITTNADAGLKEKDERTDDVLIDVDGKRLTLEQMNDSRSKDHPQLENSTALPEMIQAQWNLPAPPPDQEKGWIWHPDHGYVETGKSH